MSAPTSAKPNDALSFFRQGAWMVMATTASGVFMFAVHLFNRAMPRDEYAVFAAMLSLLNLMLIPSIGLQTVFAQQTAAAITDEKRRELTVIARGVLVGTFGIWLILALGLLLFTSDLMALWKVQNPLTLWMTLSCGLALLWIPILQGILQGLQNFMWLGWAAIMNGFGRFASVGIFVMVLGGHAAGAVSGAFLGMATAVLIAMWHSRTVWTKPAENRNPKLWREWLSRVVPLTLGLGSTMFFLSADHLAVQSSFPADLAALYVPAGMISRGLVVFTAPVAAVMFPKVVQSAVKSEKTNVLWLAFWLTAALAGAVAIVCSLFPALPIKLVYKDPQYEASIKLLPLFVWCMFPLTLSGVLINNLMARNRFGIVPILIALGVAYALALQRFNMTFTSVIKTLGVFNLLVLATALAFTLIKRDNPQRAPSK